MEGTGELSLKNLDDSKLQVFEAILEFIKTHQYSPTTRDILEALDCKSTSHIQTMLMHLIEDGFISKNLSIPRSIVINSQFYQYPDFDGFIAYGPELSYLHRTTLDHVITFIRDRKYSPSFRDLTRACQRSMWPTMCRLRKLQSLGYIDWKEHTNRTITVNQNTTPNDGRYQYKFRPQNHAIADSL